MLVVEPVVLVVAEIAVARLFVEFAGIVVLVVLGPIAFAPYLVPYESRCFYDWHDLHGWHDLYGSCDRPNFLELWTALRACRRPKI